MSSKKKSRGMTRRNFLKNAAVTALAPAIVPSRVFGRLAPSNTMLIGCIAVGRQGQGDMKELIYRGLEVGAQGGSWHARRGRCRTFIQSNQESGEI